MKLSVVIPAHNEENCLYSVVEEIHNYLSEEKIENEIIIVNDNSTDSTPEKIDKLIEKYNSIRRVDNTPPPGFGRAIKTGLDKVKGDVVAIVMGDGSDDPKDIVKCYKKIQEGYDCIFGSRFIKGAIIKDYPLVKLIFNRIGNVFIKYLFRLKCNDISNAFKVYRKEVIESVKPLVSNHFNITVEIPLKAVTRGFSYCVIPINWFGRRSGVSKYKLKELQKKYLFSILYVWLEKILLGEEIKKSRK
ncbi:MAG: glycosyltransferase family 2 protein [Elusimicrobiota bacterium]|nr:glycosyltransferase family 2 protein [Elusimicrobiota bacterium]